MPTPSLWTPLRLTIGPRPERNACTRRRLGPAVMAVLVLALCNGAAGASDLREGIEALGRGELSAAETHLRDAIRRDPSLAEAHYFLGQLQSERLEPEAAAESYETALRLDPKFAEAHLYAGVARYELGERERALQHFENAQALAPESPEAALMLGVLAEDRGDEHAARRFYAQATTLDPDGPTGKRAATRTAALMAPARHADEERPFGVSASACIAYDSDVGTTDIDAASGSGDGRGDFEIGAWWSPYREGGDELFLSYDLLQSLHFEADDFDLRTHLLRAAITRELGDVLDVGLSYGFVRAVLANSRLYHTHGLTPSVGATLGGWGLLRAGYGYEHRDFVADHPIAGPTNDRDAHRHSLRLGAFLRLPADLGRISANYRLTRQDAASDAFDYDGQLLRANWRFDLSGFSDEPPGAPWLRIEYGYERRNYDGGRRDRIHSPSVTLGVPLSGALEAEFAYEIHASDSTLARVDFVSHLLGARLKAEF